MGMTIKTATAGQCANLAWGNLRSPTTPICRPCFDKLSKQAAAIGIHLPAGPLTRRQDGQRCQQAVEEEVEFELYDSYIGID